MALELLGEEERKLRERKRKKKEMGQISGPGGERGGEEIKSHVHGT